MIITGIEGLEEPKNKGLDDTPYIELTLDALIKAREFIPHVNYDTNEYVIRRRNGKYESKKVKANQIQKNFVKDSKKGFW